MSKKSIHSLAEYNQNVTKTLNLKASRKGKAGCTPPCLSRGYSTQFTRSVLTPSWGNVDDLDLLLTYECVTISGVSIQDEHIVAVYY